MWWAVFLVVCSTCLYRSRVWRDLSWVEDVHANNLVQSNIVSVRESHDSSDYTDDNSKVLPGVPSTLMRSGHLEDPEVLYSGTENNYVTDESSDLYQYEDSWNLLENQSYVSSKQSSPVSWNSALKEESSQDYRRQDPAENGSPNGAVPAFSQGELKSGASGMPAGRNATLAVRRLPDALIIGAKKAGTRALLEYLRLHPSVKAAKHEVHFFDRQFDRGVEWYRQQMPASLPGELTVEKTPAYLRQWQVPGRVRRVLPAARLLMVVRDPATRALSDYTQSVSKKGGLRPFTARALLRPRVGPVNVRWAPVRGGLYVRHLSRWLRYFPKDRVHVVSGEALVGDPANEMMRVEDFLGLEPYITKKNFYFNKDKGFPCIVRTDNATEPDEYVYTSSGTSTDAQSALNKEDLPSLDTSSFPSSSAAEENELASNNSADVSMEALPPISRCLGSSKGRDHMHVEPNTLAILRRFYKPFNLKFFKMVGRTFDWG